MSNSIMAKEARQAPQVLCFEAPRWQSEAFAIRRLVAQRPTSVLLGRGSSGNVCTFAAYLFALQTGRQPVEFRPWLNTQPLPEADWSDAVVYAFSYSGKSTDIAASAEWLRARGALVVAVTEAGAGASNAQLLQSAHHTIRLGCGPELAVPATKSVIAQLFIAAALAGYELTQAAEQTAASLLAIDAAGVPEQLATFLEGARTVTWLARGPSIGGALDAALKLQESVAIPAFAYSTAEYLHGPIAAASPQDRVVIFSGADEPMASKQAVTIALLARGVPFLCLGCDQTPEAQLPLPFPQARWARTALLAYIAQLTCAALAERYGIDPDQHPSLRKVTQTH
ncbi:MAG: SIS domain-containing protein [Gammaproteobacteria bacterium]|uniref:SIS domain-containing protein n=1 Tax=Rhodoferax sp. TaxID=50421 RepID=UPI001DDE1033|nr:SIS domain-containing protein [Rhodoferax sp.]MBU3900964.1 SIS domain-containing protein [Gammaproteobacteria bacterium]MBU3996807.1 SIS domain-containing protein [Gammaproteobacteria bacterium]MBU4017638.1 SIS domain-containing protein [Gammaproteobacteria bacterium]MBU4081081.1 SIS domain-containing protein [Gammaproteobacteria bacterium]MBU4113260.1 SIS domain-containing protein [Gammaproteobacteria bacterium]